jgi:acyl-coenzyme A thioesterase PaaI-like protein
MEAQVDATLAGLPGGLPLGSIGEHFDVANWKIITDEPGCMRVEVPLHPWLRNPLGQLFGGFTPSYADILSTRVVRGSDRVLRESSIWYATTGVRVDYLEPIVDDSFQIECQLLKARGKSMLVETKFYQGEVLAAFAVMTLLTIPHSR